MRKNTIRIGVAGALAAAAMLALAGCSGTATADPSASAGSDSKTVTIYSADGLGDWYKKQFAAFTAKTGIAVQYVEAGSGEVVSRALKEKSNPQADVLVTLPPFIQQAQAKGLLQKTSADLSAIPAKEKDAHGEYVSLVENYASMIRGTAASPKPDAWSDLLDPSYQGKIQYSTPGQAGDGTAMLLLLEHTMGQKAALHYLGTLQKNNVGPSSSTGALGPKVSKGELVVANSDLQMAEQSIAADKSAYEVFFPKGDDGKRATVALPYAMGLAAGAPDKANGDKLIAFLLSKDVQQTISGDAFGFPVRSDVTPSDANYQTLKTALDGVELWQPDWSSVLGSLDSTVSAYKSATGQ